MEGMVRSAAMAVAVLASVVAQAAGDDAVREACFAEDARDVIAGCTVLIERDSGDLAARVRRADAFLAKGDDAKAQADYEAVLLGTTTTSDDFLAHGRAHASLGNFADARTAYDQALDIEPRNVFALVDRAEVLIAVGETAAARADLAAAVAIAPDDPEIRHRRLQLAVQIGDRSLQSEDMEALVRLNSEPKVWLRLLASQANLAGDVTGGLDLTGRLLKIAPDDAQSHTARADALFAARRPDEALAELKEAARLAPNDVALADRIWQIEARASGKPDWERMTAAERREGEIAAFGQAAAADAMGLPDVAMRLVDRALGADPRSTRALTLRGRLWLEAGDAGRALRDFETALGVTPTDLALTGWRGRARAAAGDLDGAEDDLDVAIAALPHDPALLLVRADLRAAHGDTEGARSDRAAAERLQRTDPPR